MVFANQPTSITASVNNPGNAHIPAGDPISLMASVDGDAGQSIVNSSLANSLLGLELLEDIQTGCAVWQVSHAGYFNTTRFGQGCASGGGGIEWVLHDITIWPTKLVGTGSSTPVLTLDSITLQVLYVDAAAFSVTSSSIFGLPSQVDFNQTYSIAVAAQNFGIGVNTAPIEFWAEVDQFGPVLLGTVSVPVAVNSTAYLSVPTFNLQQLYSLNSISLPANFKYQSHDLRIFAREQGLQNSLDIATFNVPPTSSLPVSLIGFEGFAEEASISLMWTTANEENNHGFIVEKLLSGNALSPSAEVAAKGSHQQYNFRDMEPVSGNVYRLRQVDIDGTETILSNQIEVTFDLDQNGLNLIAYPNQFKTKFNLQTSSPEAGTAILEMLNTKGQKVFVQNIVVEAGVQTHEVTPSRLSPGVYIVRLSSARSQASCRVCKW
ncbi:MAG: T9SS type A sorting domain-containing protein [Bacteroidia bacterium]